MGHRSIGLPSHISCLPFVLASYQETASPNTKDINVKMIRSEQALLLLSLLSATVALAPFLQRNDMQSVTKAREAASFKKSTTAPANKCDWKVGFSV